MFCKYCGNEIDNNATFCSSCGKKTSDINDNNATNVSNTANVKNGSQLPKISRIALTVFVCVIGGLFLVGVIAVILGDSEGGLSSSLSSSINKPSEEEYISAAEGIVKKQLKAPSTAIFSNERIVETDDFGRTIIGFTVESQNSFGGYVTNECYVLINSYDSEKDTFAYNRYSGVYIVEAGFDFLEETYINNLKELNDWNQPFEKISSESSNE